MSIIWKPSSSTITKLLSQPINSIKHLKHAHSLLLRFGLDDDDYLLNTLLRSTLNFNDTNYARLLFNNKRNPNIFLFNTMLRGLVSHDHFHESIEIYHFMRTQGLLPNNFTYPFVLKACARVCDFELGLKLHALVVKSGCDCNVFIETSLLNLYAKCGEIELAFKVFDDIPDKNVVSWTAIISGCIGVGKFDEGIDMFFRLAEMGLRPDSFTVVRVLSACTQIGDLRSGEWIDEYIDKNGIVRNLFVNTSFVDFYAKCGNMEKARLVFDRMVEKDIVCWSSMIQGYASNGMPKEALDLFFKMLDENLRPDRYSMVGFLCACARLGALELGNWGSSLMNRNEFLSNPVLGTALIDMYAKCGSMGRAWEIFKEMKEKDRVVWNAAISGLAMAGDVKVLFGLFGQMEKYGIQPDCNTFVGLLCGCTHAGLVDDGRRYFDSIVSVYSLSPTIEHYGCMVDLLGRAGLLDEARKLIESMPMEANSIVWGALLGGCRLHRDTQLAEHALNQLIALEPWNPGNYVLLSNIYSASHRWDAAENIRSIMREKGIQKIRGSSWIEVDGVVHEFLVGDTSHPLLEKIYAKLNELAKDLKATGYVPTTEYVLFDIEEEEKEQFIGYHSEKLAIAFGLITTDPKATIRVVKNLRVCGDCHEAIKLISEVTGREIMVRDSNRFHYFSKGSCSCKDYW